MKTIDFCQPLTSTSRTLSILIEWKIDFSFRMISDVGIESCSCLSTRIYGSFTSQVRGFVVSQYATTIFITIFETHDILGNIK